MGMIENAKSLGKLVQQLGNLDAYQKIVELQSDMLELLDENLRLKEEAAELKQSIELQESVKFEFDAYWIIRQGDQDDDGPFCSCCWDVRRQLVRLQQRAFGMECPACKFSFDHILAKKRRSREEE